MAASFTVMLTVSLLTLAGTEVSSEKNCSTLDAAKLTDRVQGIAEALECIGAILQDAVRVQQKTDDRLDVLTDKVDSLTQENKNLKNLIASKNVKIREVKAKCKRQLEKKNKKIEDLEDKQKRAEQQLVKYSENEKRQNHTIHQLEEQCKENIDVDSDKIRGVEEDLKQAREELSEKEKLLIDTVHDLQEACKEKDNNNTEKLTDLEDDLKLAHKELSEKEKLMMDTVSDLEGKLMHAKKQLSAEKKRLTHRVRNLEAAEKELKTEVERSKEQVKELQDELNEERGQLQECYANEKLLNDTVQPGTSPEDCAHRERITELVQQFLSTRSWAQLRRGLEAALANSSEEYRQLQSVGYSEDQPLVRIASNGLARLASLLLLCGGLPVDAAATARGGRVMLGVAAEAGQLDLVQLLLDHGADVNAKRGGLGMTPLMWAAQGGHRAAVRRLLQAGAGRDARRVDGSTALDLAEFFGRTETAEELKSFQP